MKQFYITFYNEDMQKICRYPYHSDNIGDIDLSDVLHVYLRLGEITSKGYCDLMNCKCVMIEEDN